MARGINKVILIGNLGAEPEVRAMPSGEKVTTVRLATSENWKDKQGEKQERTEWHRVVFFGTLATISGDYLRKGAKIYVEGSLRTRKWQDQSGQERYTTEIVASDMQMLDNKGGGSAAFPTAQDSDYAPNYPGAVAPTPAPRAAAPRPTAAPQPKVGEFDDDIPF